MSNDSFWKKVQKRMCPADRQPPSVWTMMYIFILLGGVILWLIGPWQAALPITLVLLLFAAGGQWLSKRMRKEGYYENQGAPPQKAMSPWATFWTIILLIVMVFVIKLPSGLAERYSWPEWSWMIPFFVVFIALTLIGIVYLYKRSKKMQVPYSKQDKNWIILSFIEMVFFINIGLWFIVWMYVTLPWWIKLIMLLCISFSSILGSVYPYKRLRKTLEKQPQNEQDTPITRSKK